LKTLLDRWRKSLIRIEFHCHTIYSPDSLMQPEKLLQVAHQRGLDRLAITDHNTIQGARRAATLEPDFVIVGEEIMTTEGELLAFFVQEELPAGLSPESAIARLREQEAFISVSHPYDVMRNGSWTESALDAILPLVDALEGYNARTWSDKPNHKAYAKAQQAGLPITAGSDAHAYLEVGRSGMNLPEFSDVASLREALKEAEVIRHRAPRWVHLFSRYAVWRKSLGA
jgi:hypothetical protein